MAKKCFSPEDPIKPTSVWDRKYLFYCPKLDSEENATSYCQGESTDSSSSEGSVLDTRGKWMLFLDSTRESIERGMTHLDYAWQFMKALVDDYENTGIISVGSTTANRGGRPKTEDFPEGAIVCFTKDYRNKTDVKKAADAIRKVFDYPNDMYYKTKLTSEAGLYRCRGHQNISIYKHTLKNEMYERHNSNKWELCNI